LMPYIAAYMASILVMGALDFLWLINASEPFYKPALGPLLAEKPNMPAAIAFYGLYIIGVQVLAVRPALKASDWRAAAVLGAVLGLIAYGTYDLSNLATLKAWSLKITIIDMVWGTLLTSLTASVGALAALKLRR
jgi:uncharacterized membrane protein